MGVMVILNFSPPRETAPMQPWPVRSALVIATLIVSAGVVFLINTPYLSVPFNSVFVSGFLAVTYLFVRKQFGVHIPLVLLALVFVALQVDAMGNYFHWYRPDVKPIRYDEFAHLVVPTLIMPMIVWVALRLFDVADVRAPLGLVATFAATLMLSLAAFYEILELWDDKYFGGHRIWSVFDTSEDLQWDFAGIVLGTLLARLLLRGERVSRRGHAAR